MSISAGRMAYGGRAALALLVAALLIVWFTPAPARAAHSPTGLTAASTGCTSVVPTWDSLTGRGYAGWGHQVLGTETLFQGIAEIADSRSPHDLVHGDGSDRRNGLHDRLLYRSGLSAGAHHRDRLGGLPADRGEVGPHPSGPLSGTCLGGLTSPSPIASTGNHRFTTSDENIDLATYRDHAGNDEDISLNDGDTTSGQTSRHSVAGDAEIDTVAPTCVVGEVDSTAVTLTFSEPLDATAVPRPDHFTLTVGGSSYSPHSIEVSGATVTMTLNADHAVTIGQSVTVTYHVSTDPDERLQDLSGNFVAACSSRTLQNNTTVPWIPVPFSDDWSSNPYDDDWSQQSNPCNQRWSSNPFDTPGSGPSPGQVVCD